MASFNVSPGLNTIIPKLLNTDGGGRDVASGDVVTLLNGTYTFNTNQAILLHSPALPIAPLTSLTIQGESRDGVILDLTGVGFDAIYPGDATNVIFKDFTLTQSGVPPGAGVIRDGAETVLTGCTFQNIKLDRLTKTFFDRFTTPPGVGVTIKDILTTANYAAPYVCAILGTNAALDLKIINIDARLHGTPSATIMNEVLLLRDVQDVVIDGVQATGFYNFAIQVQSNDVAKGVYDVDIFNVVANGNGTNLQPIIHVGNQTVYKVAKRVRVHGAIVSNSGSYGIEMEGGVEDSEIVNCRVTTCVNNGIPIPDSTKNILVSDCTIDGVTGALNSGIALVCGRRHRVLRNVISNCFCAVRHDEAGDVAQGSAGTFDTMTDNQLNIIRDNVIYNVSHAYRVSTVSMPPNVGGAHPVGDEAASLANTFGPNTIYTPTVAFCQIDSVNKTQAEFAAAFPNSIVTADTIVTTSSSAIDRTYSIEQCLNILAGVTTAPYNTYCAQQAANMLVGASGNVSKFSTQEALNILV